MDYRTAYRRILGSDRRHSRSLVRSAWSRCLRGAASDHTGEIVFEARLRDAGILLAYIAVAHSIGSSPLIGALCAGALTH